MNAKVYGKTQGAQDASRDRLPAAKLNISRVDTRVRDLLLNGLTFSSGAVDAICFLELGKVFTAFMTGNIAFLGMRVAGAGGPRWSAIIAAMAAFAVGVYLGTLIVNFKADGTSMCGPSRDGRARPVAHWSCWISNSVARAWRTPFHGRGKLAHRSVGAAMGMQSAAVRSLHVEGVFTTAATATFMFLFGDFATWSKSAEERRRLRGVLFALFLGATAGGSLLARARIYAPALPLIATAIVVATAAMLFGERIKG